MINFWDQTLRDGEQSPGVFFTPSEKVRLAEELDKVGVKRAEVGFPIVSQDESIAVRKILDQGLKMKVVCPARCATGDIDAVAETGAKEVAVFIGTSPQLMKYSLRLTPAQVISRLVDSVEYAVERGLHVHAVSEDSTRSDREFVIRALRESVSAGARGVVITDTLGVATPNKMYTFARQVRRRVRAKSYSVHAHDDLGLATATTLAAIEAGFDAPQTTVNGIGERSGNTSFEEVALALEILYGIKTGIRHERIFHLAELVEKLSGVPIPVHKPVIGTNSFSHEAGVHVAAVLRNPVTYEPFPPEKIGRTRRFSLGKHSGSAIIEHLQPGSSPAQIARLTAKVKSLKRQMGKRNLQRLVVSKKALDRERSGVTAAEFRKLVSASR
ncbi:MAG TPA: homoaconitate hydratase [Candidatus Bathyarchaeia archaeon]|nr:homoaconitate hydratase [Candidatus Bathyarchaeia archaeon]